MATEGIRRGEPGYPGSTPVTSPTATIQRHETPSFGCVPAHKARAACKHIRPATGPPVALVPAVDRQKRKKKKNQRARPRHHHAFFFLTVPRPYAAPRSEKYHANSGTLCPAARIPTSRMPRKSPITPWRPSYDEESVRIRIGASYFPRKDNLPLDITDVSQEGGAGSSGYKCLRQGRAAEVGEKRR